MTNEIQPTTRKEALAKERALIAEATVIEKDTAPTKKEKRSKKGIIIASIGGAAIVAGAIAGISTTHASKPNASPAEGGVAPGTSESATPTQSAEAADDPLTREQMITLQENCSDVFIDTQAYATIENMSQADADYIYQLGSRENDPTACEVVGTIVKRVESEQ